MAMLIMTRFPGMNQLSFAYGAVTPPNAEQIFESQFNLNSPGIGGKIVNGAVEVGAFVYDLF